MFARITRREDLRAREGGFTLIELLVVVIIIGILAAIAIPIYIGVQNNAKDSAVKSDLHNIKTSVIAYYTATGTNAAPLLSVNVLGGYGFTQNAAYAPGGAPTFKAGQTSTVFCIYATSVTNSTFNITSNGGIGTGTCV